MKTEELKGTDIWQPENEGDKIDCIVQEIDTEGLYGLRLLVNVPELGKEMYTPSHKALQSRLVAVKKGDRLLITFMGEEPPSKKGNNPTKIYKVERVIDE